MVCMARVESIQLQTSIHRDLTQLWVVDSGSEKHLSCRRDWFGDDFIPHLVSIKAVGGGIISEQGGHGTIRVPCKAFGKKVTLHLSDVTYSPSCGVNLVSTGRLTSK